MSGNEAKSHFECDEMSGTLRDKYEHTTEGEVGSIRDIARFSQKRCGQVCNYCGGYHAS